MIDDIKPAQTNSTSRTVVIANKYGSPRFCIDRLRLNAVKIQYSYRLPHTKECIDSLGDAIVFLTLVARSGYYQVEVANRDRKNGIYFILKALLFHAHSFCPEENTRDASTSDGLPT